MSLLDTVSEGAQSISSGIGSLMNGSGPKLSAKQKENRKHFSDGIHDLLRYDVGRSSYFKVDIFSEKFNWLNPGGALSYLCHSAELPGESTATVNQKIYGVSEKFSVMTGYTDIQLAFYTRGSKDEMVRKFFQQWIAFITGRLETTSTSKTETTYNVQYKDEYASTIKITQYSIAGEPLIEVTLVDAFPIAINQIPLSWSYQNQAQSLNVVFAYTEYSYKFLTANGNGPYSKGPLGELLGTALKATSAINTIQGAFKSGNPIAATSALPSLGLSNFTLSSGMKNIGL